MTVQTCPMCGGSGRVVCEACSSCSSSGVWVEDAGDGDPLDNWDPFDDDDAFVTDRDDMGPCGCRYCFCEDLTLGGATCSNCESGVHQG